MREKEEEDASHRGGCYTTQEGSTFHPQHSQTRGRGAPWRSGNRLVLNEADTALTLSAALRSATALTRLWTVSAFHHVH